MMERVPASAEIRKFHKPNIHMKTIVTVIILSCLLSCQQAPVNFEGGGHEMEARVALLSSPVPGKSSADQVGQQEMNTGRKLIRSGYLNIVVRDVSATRTEIENLCKTYEAYISSETQANYPGRLEYNQVMRIPAAQFDQFVSKVERLATRVENKNIETSDVTEEFIDNEARIKTKKELEQRYREILKKPDKVSDILSIEAQLNHVRADIESMEGRLTFLKSQVTFSTLTISFYEPVGAETAFGAKTVAAFTQGWNLLLTLLVGLVSIWPFLLLIAGLTYVVVRRMRDRHAKVRPETAG
jgi:hypothetical protein